MTALPYPRAPRQLGGRTPAAGIEERNREEVPIADRALSFSAAPS
jgi:hypothetical protein